MSDDVWIVIPGWKELQHYKKRRPVWIKLYVDLLADDAYLRLTGHERAVLSGIWLAYAQSDGRLRLDTRSITRRLSLRVTMATLERLNEAGFIDIPASTSLAQRQRQRQREKHANRNKRTVLGERTRGQAVTEAARKRRAAS